MEPLALAEGMKALEEEQVLWRPGVQALEVKEALKQLCLTGDPDTLSAVLLNLEEGDNHTGYVQPKYKKVSNVSQQQKCPHCGKIIVERGNMQQHITAKHPNAREYNCNECPFSSAHKAQLKKHRNSMHTRSSYVCPQCDQKCKTKNNLDWHIRAKHEESKPSCDTLDSWVREGEEEEDMAGSALLATQSKLGRPLLQDEITFVRMQVEKIQLRMIGRRDRSAEDQSRMEKLGNRITNLRDRKFRGEPLLIIPKVPALTDVERTRNWRRRLTDEKAAEVREKNKWKARERRAAISREEKRIKEGKVLRCMYQQCEATFASMGEKLEHGEKIIFDSDSHSGPKRHPADQGLDGNGMPDDGGCRTKRQNLELDENLMDWWSPYGSPLSRFESY